MIFLKILKKEMKYKIIFMLLFYVVYVILFVCSQKRIAYYDIFLEVISLIVASSIWGEEQSMDIVLLTDAGLKKIMIARFIAIVLALCLLPGLHTFIFSSEGTRYRLTFVYVVTIFFNCSLAVLIRTIVNDLMGSVIFSFSIYTILIFPGILFGEVGDKIRKLPFYPMFSFDIARDSDFIRNRVVVCIMSVCLIGIAYFILWYKEKKILKINV